MGHGKFRSQLYRLPSDFWPRQCSLRLLPRKQQLQSTNCSDGMRDFGMPRDDVATDEQSGSFDLGSGLRTGQLLELPHNQGLGRGFV